MRKRFLGGANLAVLIFKKLELKNFEYIRWKMIKIYDIILSRQNTENLFLMEIFGKTI